MKHKLPELERVEQELHTIKNILLVFLAILFAYILRELSPIFIPLAFAFFIAILLYPLLDWFRERNVPFALSLTLILICAFFILNAFGNVVYDMAMTILSEQDKFLAQMKHKFEPWMGLTKRLTGVDLKNYSGGFSGLVQKFITFNQIQDFSGTFANFITSLASTLFMTTLYLVVILGGIMHYDTFFNDLERSSKAKSGSLIATFEQVKTSITVYMKVKFLISFATGFSYWFLCKIFGVDFALFWGFLAFVLNFIPTFGSIIASVPPVALGWIQIEPLWLFVIFISLLVTVQVVWGNIIDPVLTGNRLSINTVFVLLGLVFWTYMWGIIGTLLSVPLMVLVKVILEQIPDAAILVRLMGGQVPERDPEEHLILPDQASKL